MVSSATLPEVTSQSSCREHIAQAISGAIVPPRVYHQNIPSCHLRYTIAGRGPLLIAQAPGWGIGSSYLEAGLSPLEADNTILYLEPRGSRLSTRPQDATQMITSLMIDDLEQVRQYIGCEQLSILGHSHGGIIALGYAARYPDRVSKLILVVHALFGYDDQASWDRIENARKGDARFESAYAERQRAMAHPPTTDAEYTAQFKKRMAYCFAHPERFQAVFLETVTNDLSLWTWDAINAADVSLAGKMNQVDYLEKVTARTLVVGARDDPLGSVDVSNITHRGLKSSELVILEDCGHFPWIEKKTEFFDHVRHFLQE